MIHNVPVFQHLNSMPLSFFLRRVLQLPPQETVRRAWALLTASAGRRWQRWREGRHPTYSTREAVASLSLQRFLHPFPANLLYPHREQIAHQAKLALAHCFDLLGSSRVEVRHGMSCSGVGSYRYSPGPSLFPDSQGRWLSGRVNRPNLSRAVDLWRLIRPDYVPIDWSLDFLSGYRWPERTWHGDIVYGHLPGVDVKVPWELARMQHLPQLAWAYVLAQGTESGLHGPAVYLREFQDQVLDFLATNPPRYGVNWKCTMDVAIRAAGWLVCRDLFLAHGAIFEPPFEDAFLRGVYEHGRFIIEHLEWASEVRANHYLADLAGLVFVAGYLQGTAEVDRWLSFSLAELIQETAGQFHLDGSNFEASTSYHRLSAEMVAYATALGLALPEERLRRLANQAPPSFRPGPPARLVLHEIPGTGPVPFPPSHLEQLGRMAGFTRAVTGPTGRAAQIGDNDNGRFLKLWPALVAGPHGWQEDLLDHRHLVAALSAFLNRPDFTAWAGDAVIETEVVRALAGREPLAGLGKLIPTLREEEAPPSLQVFPDFGLFVYRTARLTVLVRCGPVGQKGNGGHAHNDQLSLELWLDGQPLIVDPGTYVYTSIPEERNRFRSTVFHNTLAIERREQNPWIDGREGLFALEDRTLARVLECRPGVFIGEHVGYGLPHRRTLTIAEGAVSGCDECAAADEKRLSFHLAPEIEVQQTSAAMVLARVGGKAVVFCLETGQWSVEPAWYSPGYGQRVATSVCVVRFQGPALRWHIQVSPAAPPDGF